jgi:septal ring factor EnvC (AmiA/AmiB activator)
MGKKRKTFSLDEDVETELSNRDHLNASSLANEFFRQYLFQGESQDAALHMRKNDIDRQIENTRQEISHLESKLERLQDEKEQVKDMIRQRRQSGLEQIDEAVETVKNSPNFTIEPDNPAIQQWAQDANMTPERFISELEDRL